MLKGIDISDYNGIIDFEKVKNAGIDVVIMRCGYGKEISQKDKEFEQYYEKANGKFKLATYLYSYADNVENAKLEAQNTLKLIEGKQFDYIFYDLEDKQAENLSKETLTNMYFAYREVIEKAGHKCAIYTGAYWAENKIDMSKINDLKWIASYGDNDGNVPSENVKYSNCDIWQYTDKGKIDGINGNVDLNIVYNWENKQEENQMISENKGKENEESIAKIQLTINSRYGFSIVVDNIYGKETKKALVKGLQTELNKQYGKGLIVDGIFGTNTKNDCVTVKKGAKGNITYIIQAILFCKGYNTKGVDGIFGTGTEVAVKQFQKDSELVIDGIVGKNTFSKLFQ